MLWILDDFEPTLSLWIFSELWFCLWTWAWLPALIVCLIAHRCCYILLAFVLCTALTIYIARFVSLTRRCSRILLTFASHRSGHIFCAPCTSRAPLQPQDARFCFARTVLYLAAILGCYTCHRCYTRLLYLATLLACDIWLLYSAAILGCYTWLLYLAAIFAIAAILTCYIWLPYSPAILGCDTWLRYLAAILGCFTCHGCYTWLLYSAAILGCYTWLSCYTWLLY